MAGEILKVRLQKELMAAVRTAAARDRRQLSDWIRLELQDALARRRRRPANRKRANRDR